MSESLFIRFCLDASLDSAAIESMYRFCFDELGCARSPPSSDDTSQFRYMTAETDPDLVTGSSVDEAIRAAVSSEWSAIWFWFDDLHVGIHRNDDVADENGPNVPSVSVSVDEWFTKPWHNEQPSLIYEFVLSLSDILSPVYVYGDRHLDEPELSASSVLQRELEELFWVNGFGPEMADRVGRDRLLDAPAWRIDERDDGTVFLWVSPLPLSDGRNERLSELRDHFGLD